MLEQFSSYRGSAKVPTSETLGPAFLLVASCSSSMSESMDTLTVWEVLTDGEPYSMLLSKAALKKKSNKNRLTRRNSNPSLLRTSAYLKIRRM